MSIRIVNPVPGGASFTTRQRALHFIRLQIAVWTDDQQNAVRFSDLANDRMVRRHAKQASRADEELRQHEKATRDGYDQRRKPLTERELRALPCAGDVSRLMTVRRNAR